ncbi:hypothetical protein N566_15580, partial [Streptomycetaceae bacterium MP113-05]
AVRRLQLDSGTAARAVGGITIAVAGSIALAGLFGAVAEQESEETGMDPSRAQLTVFLNTSNSEHGDAALARMSDSPGVRSVLTVIRSSAFEAGKDPEGAPHAGVTVADCATLQELAALPACENGDAFVAPATGETAQYVADVKPGMRLDFGDTEYGPEGQVKSHTPLLWTVPEDAPQVKGLRNPMGSLTDGVLATPAALDADRLPSTATRLFVRTDPAEPDAAEYVRNAATAAVGPEVYVMALTSERSSAELAMIQRGLYVGAVGVLLLIGASMIVSTLEQLRERKRLLSVLVAFGTRRSTLAWSVWWQTALPVLLGLALAALTGAGLGAVLLRIADLPMGVDWAALGLLTSLGGALIVLVTLLSLPVLWRLMRPNGLRTE